MTRNKTIRFWRKFGSLCGSKDFKKEFLLLRDKGKCTNFADKSKSCQ